MIDRIIDRSDMVTIIRKEKAEGKSTKPDPRELARTKTEKARAESKKQLPDAYWQEYNAIEVRFIEGINNTDALALEDYKRTLRDRLVTATDEELKQIDASPDLSQSPALKRVTSIYTMMAVGFFSDKNTYTRRALESYLNEMKQLNAKFGTS